MRFKVPRRFPDFNCGPSNSQALRGLGLSLEAPASGLAEYEDSESTIGVPWCWAK